MPTRKVILPTFAGLVLLAIMWFAFRDDSAEAPVPKAAPVTRAVASAVAVAASEPTPEGRPMATRAAHPGQFGEIAPLRKEAGKAPKP